MKLQEKLSKGVKFCLIVFLICSFLAILCRELNNWITCFYGENTTFYIIQQIFGPAYGAQTYLILIIFFNRLSRVFGDTMFQLSRNTIRFYYISFIGLLIYIAFLSALMHILPLTIYLILIGIWGICFLGLLISLVALFIAKLFTVYKNASICDTSLVSTITTATLLTVISVGMTFVTLASMSIYYANINDDKYFNLLGWTLNNMVLADCYANFLCVILGYTPFKPYYKILCKCLDGLFRKCWIKIVAKSIGNEKHLVDIVQMNTNSVVASTTNKSASTSPVDFTNTSHTNTTRNANV
eukprot:400888_1